MTGPKDACLSLHATKPTADIVRSMVAHFAVTGTYRAEDICRVLGNPIDGVILKPVPTAEVSYRNGD